MAKKESDPKTDAIDLSTIGINVSLEVLMQTFQGFVNGVERQIAAENDEQLTSAKGESRAALQAVLTEEVSRRDQLVSLLSALEERAQRIRKTVSKAEKLARHYEAFVKNMEGSIELYMIEQNIGEITGEMHRFKLYKGVDQLQVEDNLVPAEYRKFPLEHRMAEALRAGRAALVTMIKSSQTEFTNTPESYPTVAQIDRVLAEVGPESSLGSPDKDKITAALKAGKEVAGCFMLTERRRLDVK